MKIQKVDFDGYGIDYIRKDIDLRVIALTKYCLVDESVFQTGKPVLGTAVPIELDIYSKISAVQSDFSLKDIVPESNVELAICAYNESSVIYCEKRENQIFKCTSSENEYISFSDSIFYECYDDVFVVEESDDYGSKKVIAFDMELNKINSSVIASSDFNEYEIAKQNKQSVFNNYTDNTLVFESCYYVLDFTDKRGNKWRLTKFANDGQPLDDYDFRGGDARLTLYNRKPVIVYKDFSVLTPQQKLIYKTTGGFIGPAAMLIVD